MWAARVEQAIREDVAAGLPAARCRLCGINAATEDGHCNADCGEDVGYRGEDPCGGTYWE